MSYADAFLATAPVAYYLGADAVGATTAKDSSGHGHDATVQGTVTFGASSLIPGDSNMGVLLGGAGVLAAPAVSLTPPFTLSCLIAPTGDAGSSTGYGSLFGFGGPTLGNRRVLWADTTLGSKILVQMGAANLTTAANSVPASAPAHVVYRNDATTESVYINGVLAASQHNSAATWDQAFYIGGYGPYPGGAYLLESTVQHVGVNNTALDPVVIGQLSAWALDPQSIAAGTQAMIWNATTGTYAPGLLQIYYGGTEQPAATGPTLWVQDAS